MKRSRFNEEQIIMILWEQESGSNTAEVCGVTEDRRVSSAASRAPRILAANALIAIELVAAAPR